MLAWKGRCRIEGGPSGDLYVDIHIEDHPLFERDTIFFMRYKSLSLAALGGIMGSTLDDDCLEDSCRNSIQQNI